LFPIRPDVDTTENGGVGVEAKEGDEEEEEEQVEEAKVSKPARDPGAPTKAEIEEHEATHLPFRSWCPCCVAGRRDNPPHRRREDEERQVPEVTMDYAFVGGRTRLRTSRSLSSRIGTRERFEEP
jgi:hypothetical protein